MGVAIDGRCWGVLRWIKEENEGGSREWLATGGGRCWQPNYE